MSINRIGSQPPDMGDDGALDKLAEPLAGKIQESLAVKGEAMIKEVADTTSTAAPPQLDQAESTLLGDHKLQGMLVRDKLQLGDEKVCQVLADQRPRLDDDLQIKHKIQLGDELTAQTQHKLPGDLQTKHKLQLGDEKVSLISHKLPDDLQTKHKMQLSDERMLDIGSLQVQGKIDFADQKMSVVGGAIDERGVWAAKLQGGGTSATRSDDEEGGEPLLAKGMMSGAAAGAVQIEDVKGDTDFQLHKEVGLAGRSWAGVGDSPGVETGKKWVKGLSETETSGALLDKDHKAGLKHGGDLERVGKFWAAAEAESYKVVEDVKLAQSSNIWGERDAGLGGAAGDARVKLGEPGIDADHKLPGIEHK